MKVTTIDTHGLRRVQPPAYNEVVTVHTNNVPSSQYHNVGTSTYRPPPYGPNVIVAPSPYVILHPAASLDQGHQLPAPPRYIGNVGTTSAMTSNPPMGSYVLPQYSNMHANSSNSENGIYNVQPGVKNEPMGSWEVRVPNQEQQQQQHPYYTVNGEYVSTNVNFVPGCWGTKGDIENDETEDEDDSPTRKRSRLEKDSPNSSMSSPRVLPSLKFYCGECNLTFSTKENLDIHVAQHEPPRYTCLYKTCPRKFERPKHQLRHLISVHPIDDKKGLSCHYPFNKDKSWRPPCNRNVVYYTYEDFLAHLKESHTEFSKPGLLLLSCMRDDCHYETWTRADLAKHMRDVHDGVKCKHPGCNQVFIKKVHGEQAFAIHKNSHRYATCHFCQRDFHPAGLDRHFLTCAKRPDLDLVKREPVLCPAPGCTSTFARRDGCARHFARVHPTLEFPRVRKRKNSGAGSVAAGAKALQAVAAAAAAMDTPIQEAEDSGVDDS